MQCRSPGASSRRLLIGSSGARIGRTPTSRRCRTTAIRMLIAPIIFCTVVHGIAHMADMARVGRVAIKAIVYFEIMTTVALVIGLIAVNLLKPGVGMNIDPATINAGAVEPYVKQTAAVGFVPFLMNIIPGTFVGAFAEGNILQVLFISVVCGFA